MCSTIDYTNPSYQKEPEEGEGWKIFAVYPRGLYSMTTHRRVEPYLINEWIHFKTKYMSFYPDNDGFCFFLDKEIAKDVLFKWSTSDIHDIHEQKYQNFSYQLYKIHYKECLGSMLMWIIDYYGHRGAIAKQILIKGEKLWKKQLYKTDHTQ